MNNTIFTNDSSAFHFEYVCAGPMAECSQQQPLGQGILLLFRLTEWRSAAQRDKVTHTRTFAPAARRGTREHRTRWLSETTG